MRKVTVDEYVHYDIQIVLSVKKNSTDFIIDSISFNNSSSLDFKLSVLGKDISTKEYSKRDSVLLQFIVPGRYETNNNRIKLSYHISSQKKAKHVYIDDIKLLDNINIQRNQ